MTHCRTKIGGILDASAVYHDYDDKIKKYLKVHNKLKMRQIMTIIVTHCRPKIWGILSAFAVSRLMMMMMIMINVIQHDNHDNNKNEKL